MRVLVFVGLSVKVHREEYVTRTKEEIKENIKKVWDNADITLIGHDDLEMDNKIDILKTISNVTWDMMFYYDYSIPYLHGLLDGIVDPDLWNHTEDYDELETIVTRFYDF